jgi:hypothetical protein
MIINQESIIFINPMFLLLCVLCEMVGVTHNYYCYSILKRHERDKLKTLLLSLNYTTTIHTLCIEHIYVYEIKISTFAERTMILSSVIGSIDEDSFVRKCFTMRFVDCKGYPLDPVFRHLMRGIPLISLIIAAALVRTDMNVTDIEP